MQYYSRTCVLCTEKIPSTRKLCTHCFAQYKDQMHEQWFEALAREQAKQDIIDRRERYNIPYGSTTDIYGIQAKPELLAKRNIGRPPTDWRIIQRILELYDQSLEDIVYKKRTRPLSLRAIAAEIDGKVSYLTVRTILRSYRNMLKN